MLTRPLGQSLRLCGFTILHFCSYRISTRGSLLYVVIYVLLLIVLQAAKSLGKDKIKTLRKFLELNKAAREAILKSRSVVFRFVYQRALTERARQVLAKRD